MADKMFGRIFGLGPGVFLECGELAGSAPRCHLQPLTLSGRTNSVFMSMVPLLETTLSKMPDMSMFTAMMQKTG